MAVNTATPRPISNARARAAAFMIDWLRRNMPKRWPRGQQPGSLFDTRALEWRRRAWDALHQDDPATWAAAWTAGPADVEAMVNRVLWEEVSR